MKNRSLALLSALFLLTAASASAEQDFYGIQMKNERWAKNLVWNAAPAANQADLLEGPVLSHDITAEASLKEIADERIDFRVTVFNGSFVPISTDYHFRDFFITARDGRKYPLIDSQTRSELDIIEPKASVTFNPSLGNLRLKNKDVMLIECSFDLGKTKVFLFPWSQKDVVSKLLSPPPPEISETGTRGRGTSQESSKAKWKTPKRNFWERLSGHKTHKAARKGVSPESSGPPPASKRASMNPQAAPQAPAPSGARTPNRLEDAIKNFVYVPANTTGQVARTLTGSAANAPGAGPRAEAHVIGFNKTYSFVTLNVGSRDGLRDNMVLSILQNGRTVAKARVKELREAVSAAALIPETVKAEIRPGDQVSLV